MTQSDYVAPFYGIDVGAIVKWQEDLENKIKWDKRFLNLAQHISTWSKDPSTKCGAVIADGKKVISVGYNGFPQSIDDSPERYDDRELKYKMVIHAETNALLFAQRDLTGLTLYTWPFMTCNRCAVSVIRAGITRVVAPENTTGRWLEEFTLATELFKEAGVEIKLYG